MSEYLKLKINGDGERISLIDTISGATSIQAKITNKLWLSVMVVTIMILLSTISGENNSTMAKLPLNLGEVSVDVFYPIVFMILSVLMIGLAATHAQQIRADKIAHYIIENLSSHSETDLSKVNSTGNILHLKDLFDILRYPSFTRVAPLPALLTNFYHTQQIIGKKSSNSIFECIQRLARSIIYIILKFVALVVLFILPIFTLVLSFNRVKEYVEGWLFYVLLIFGIVAFLTLLAIAIVDFKYILHISRKICEK